MQGYSELLPLLEDFSGQWDIYEILGAQNLFQYPPTY